MAGVNSLVISVVIAFKDNEVGREIIKEKYLLRWIEQRVKSF